MRLQRERQTDEEEYTETEEGEKVIKSDVKLKMDYIVKLSFQLIMINGCRQQYLRVLGRK